MFKIFNRNEDYEKLKKYNLFMGGLHFLQALVLFLLSNNFTLPITTDFLRFDEAQQALVTATKTLVDLPFAPFVALFLLLSALAHFSVATFGYDWYVRNLKKKQNPARWIEYSISASLMIILIAMLSGVYDLSTLVAVFALTAIMNLMGLVMELVYEAKPKVGWLSYWIGSFAGLIPWIIIAIFFAGAATEPGSAIPTFVYWIYGSLFVFFNLFAVNMYLQYKEVGKWKDYLFGEYMYVLLSLTAKSALAWQVFAGTLQPM